MEEPGAVHGDAALVRDVTGLPGSPVGEEDGPAIRPGVGGVLRAQEMPGSIYDPFHLTCRKNILELFLVA